MNLIKIRLALLFLFCIGITYDSDITPDAASLSSFDIMDLMPNQTYEMSVETRSRLNVTIRSDSIVKIKIHASDGTVLKYKSTLVKTANKIDNIKIENGDRTNLIRIRIQKLKKNTSLDLETIAGLAVTIVMIADRKSTWSALALTTYLALRIYNTSLTGETADRVFKKYIF